MNECYRQVIHLSEQQQSIDSDYLTALFFANDKRFEPLKNRLIKEGVFKESDLLIFTLSKEDDVTRVLSIVYGCRKITVSTVLNIEYSAYQVWQAVKQVLSSSD